MRGVRSINSRFEKDAAEIIELITHNLRGKYVAPFEEMLRSRNEILKENPPPEIGLLVALKPFVDRECCSVIDKLVSSYSLATMAKVMAEDLIHSQKAFEPRNHGNIKSNEDVMQGLQFSNLSIILPLLILLIFIETH